MHPYKKIGTIDMRPGCPESGIMLGTGWPIPCPLWAEIGVHEGRFGVVIRNNHQIIQETYNLESVSVTT